MFFTLTQLLWLDITIIITVSMLVSLRARKQASTEQSAAAPQIEEKDTTEASSPRTTRPTAMELEAKAYPPIDRAEITRLRAEAAEANRKYREGSGRMIDYDN